MAVVEALIANCLVSLVVGPRRRNQDGDRWEISAVSETGVCAGQCINQIPNFTWVSESVLRTNLSVLEGWYNIVYPPPDTHLWLKPPCCSTALKICIELRILSSDLSLSHDRVAWGELAGGIIVNRRLEVFKPFVISKCFVFFYIEMKSMNPFLQKGWQEILKEGSKTSQARMRYEANHALQIHKGDYFLNIFLMNLHTGWPRSGWPLSTTLCYKSVTGLNHHTELLLIFHLVGSDIRKKYWKFHNDTVNSFGVMGKGNAIFQPYFHVTMSHFKFSYFLNSCPHKIEVLEQFLDFWLHSKYGFIWFIGHLMQITWKMTKLWHFTKNWFRYTS